MIKEMLCIKDFYMKTGALAYKKGEIYVYDKGRWGDDNWPYDFKSEVTERMVHQMSQKLVDELFIDPNKYEYVKAEDLEIEI